MSELRNPDTGAAFYVTQHAETSSSTVETFTVDVDTSAGACKSTPSLHKEPANQRTVTIPQHGTTVTINGHQSKIIVTDFSFGSKSLLYSTAEVLTYAIIDGQEVLALWVPTGESGEFTIEGVSSATLASGDKCANLKIYPGRSNVTVSFMQNAGMTILELGDGSKVVLLDRSAAYLFWSPALDNNPLEAGNNTRKSTGSDKKTWLTSRSTCTGSLSCPYCCNR